MGYREYAKDYKIEYVTGPGQRRPHPVRVYVGPWFRFEQPEDKIRFLRWFYLIGVAAVAVALLIPMCFDSLFTRIWYIQVVAMVAWIPWVFAVCAAWRLWTAKEKVTREHRDMLESRMSPACLFVAIFSLFSFGGCVYAAFKYPVTAPDYVVAVCCFLSSACGLAMFSRRKQLKMVQTD